jgi:kinesin family member C2/C3
VRFRIRDERSTDYSYEFKVSMLEVYNEQMRDLLTSESKDPEELKIRKHKNGNMIIDGLTEFTVSNEKDVLKLMTTGNQHRAVGVTNMNEHSSRSHSILMVHVNGLHRTTNTHYFGKLHMDLSASFRTFGDCGTACISSLIDSGPPVTAWCSLCWYAVM